MLSNTSTKPIPRSVGLYFYRRGFKAGFHGSPTLLDFNRFQQIPDWQQYLKNLVLQHPACISYPNIKFYELHPRLPICAGYWDGTTTGIASNANLLRLTDKPNCPHSVQTQLVTVKGSRSVSSILRMAITIHLQQIGDDSDDEDSNIQPSIKQEAIDFASIKLPSTLKSKQVTLSTKSEPRSANSSPLIRRQLLFKNQII